MKNLSKALSLMLSSALAFTMVAGAVEFTDISDVKNSDAVKTMSSLGIIKGYPDGKFNPEGTVTRAEMAKMIYVYMNGGVDDEAAYFKGTSASKLKDISGHWAEGYIKYCESMNIIAGRGDGNFYPDDTVTGLEAAKMLLVVQGYNDPVKAGLVGSNWALKTQTLGSRSELFRNYGVDLSQGCPRQYAALMMYNSLDATYMTYDNNLGDYVKSTNTKDTVTLGERYLNLVTIEGVVDAAGDVSIGGTAGTDKISVDVEKINDSTAAPTAGTPAATFTIGRSATLKVDDKNGYDLLGQYVRASVNTRDQSVIGIFSVDSKNTVVNTTADKVQLVTNEENKIKIDETEYKIEDNNATTAGTQNNVIVLGAGTDGNSVKTSGAVTIMGVGTLVDSDWRTVFNGTVSNALANASAVKFIDNDADDKFEYIIVTPISAVSKVTNVSSTGFSANGTYNFKDVIVNGEVKKDEYVVRTYNAFESKYVFDVLKSFEGEVSAIKDSGKSAKIDGKWYRLSADTSSKMFDFSGTTFTAGSTYKLYAVGDVVYAGQKIAAGSTDIAIVKSVSSAAAGAAGEYEVSLYFPNDKKASTEKVIVKSYTTAAHTTLNGTLVNPTDKGTKPDEGVLVTYEKSSDYNNMYDIYYVGGYDKDGELIDAGYSTVMVGAEGVFTGIVGAYNAAKEVLGTSVTIDDDALVVIAYDDDGSVPNQTAANANTKVSELKFDVKTGKELKDLSANFGQRYSYLSNDKDFGKAEVIFIYDTTDTLTIGMKDKVLGFVTDRAKDSKNTTLTIWDGETTRDITVSGSSATYNRYSVGSPIYMSESTNNVYEKEDVVNIQSVYNTTPTAPAYGLGAVTASNSKSVRVYDVDDGYKTYNITDDTVIISVDTDAQTGNNDGVTTASKVSEVTKVADYSTVKRVTIDKTEYFVNAYYVVDGTDLLYLVVDSKGAWHGSKTAAEVAATAAAEAATKVTSGVATIGDGTSTVTVKVSDLDTSLANTEIKVAANAILVIDQNLTVKKITNNTTDANAIQVANNVTLTTKEEPTAAILNLVKLTDTASYLKVATGSATKANNTYAGATKKVVGLDGTNTTATTWQDATSTDIAASVTINGSFNTTGDVTVSSTAVMLNGTWNIDGNATGTSTVLTLGSEGKLDIAGAKTLKVKSLTVGKTTYTDSDELKAELEALVAAGNLTVANGAKIQVTDVASNGTATFTVDAQNNVTVAMS